MAKNDPEGVDDGRIVLDPEQVPEQFRNNPSAVFQSYEESRKEMDRLRSQLEEERAQHLEMLTAQQERQQQFTAQQQQQAPQGLDPQTQAQLAAYQQAVESGDATAQLAITLALSQQLNQQAVAAAIDQKLSGFTPELEAQKQVDRDNAFRMAELRVANQYGDQWKDIQPEVQKWLHEHPVFLPQVNTIDAFEPVIAEAARSVQNQKAAEELAGIQADRAAKLAAQTATGGGVSKHPTNTDEKKQAWEEVKAAAHVSYADIARS